MVFFTAELGINHNGDIEIAKQLIDAAKIAGCNAVKFQKRTVEKVFSKDVLDTPRESPWGTTTREQKLGLEFEKNEYDIIDKYCESKNIEWFASSWDINSQHFLKQYNLKHNKIASAMLTHKKLLEVIASEKKYTFISTGMSTFSEIVTAVETLKNKNATFCLLHCNSSYPSPIEDANLNTIPYFKKVFDVPIGYSDHTLGLDACLTAVSMGAKIIEKHFTLDKNMDGPDQKLSSDPKEIKELVSKIRTIEKLQGHIRSNVTNSEQKFRKLMRKSLAVNKDVKARTKITKNMLMSIRPGTGIPPTQINQIIGMTLKKDIKKDTLLSNQLF